MLKRLGLVWRIVLPLAGLVAIAFAVAIGLAVQLLSNDIDRRLQDRLTDASAFLSTRGWGLREQVLEQMANAYGVQIVADLPDGRLITTFPEGSQLPEAWRTSNPENHDTLVWNKYRVVRTEVQTSDEPDARAGNLYFLESVEVWERARREVLRPMVGYAALGFLLALALGVGLAWTVQRPLREMAEFSRSVADGEFSADVPVVADETEIGQLAGAFQSMLDALREHEETRVRTEKLAITGQLAASVAHEVRNPLSAVRMTLQMWGKRGPEEIREDAERILQEIDRIDLVLSELLDLTSGGAGGELKPINLADLVDDVQKLLAAKCEHLGMGLEIENDVRPTIVGDPVRMKGVLMNLCLNGIQAMETGGALIVQTFAGDAGVGIRVTDTGPGVDPSIQDQMYEPFVSGRETGTGLGLTYCRQVIEAAGGKISFVRQGERTVFEVTLPAATSG